jgi:hypothetical protein
MSYDLAELGPETATWYADGDRLPVSTA